MRDLVPETGVVELDVALLDGGADGGGAGGAAGKNGNT